MRLNLALTLVLAAALSGCSGAPEASPTQTTAAAKTTAQVASAVAKTRPQLEDAMNRFDEGKCVPVMEFGSSDGLKTMACVNAFTDMAAHSRIMQKDLDDAKPWPEETRALAEETVLRLEKMMEAANYGDGKSMAVTTNAIEFLRSQLQAWKPFGA